MKKGQKRRVDPTLLHKWQLENLGNGYKRSWLAKSECICTHCYKTVFMNMVKNSLLIESTLSPISLFWQRPRTWAFANWLKRGKNDNDPAPEPLPADSKEERMTMTPHLSLCQQTQKRKEWLWPHTWACASWLKRGKNDNDPTPEPMPADSKEERIAMTLHLSLCQQTQKRKEWLWPHTWACASWL